MEKKKQVFSDSFNLPKCIVVGFLMVVWLRNIVRSYFENASSSPSEITCLVFCSVQYNKTKLKGVAVNCFLFLKPVIGNLPQSK